MYFMKYDEITCELERSLSPDKGVLTLLLLNTRTCPVLANRIDPDHLKPTDLDLHCLSLNMWISIKTWIK